MLKLFYTPGTCALASHIALEEAGAKFDLARVDFKADDQKKPEFLAVNPKGRVPALVTDKGVLTETPAILAFICQKFPDAGLGPNGDPFAFAQMQSFNSYLCSTVHIKLGPGFFQCLFGSFEGWRDCVRVGDVKLNGQRLAAFGFNGFDALMQPLNTTCGECYFRAGMCKRVCKVTPEAGRGSGNECRAAGKVEGVGHNFTASS